MNSDESGAQAVAAFYDLRGEADFKNETNTLGFARYPLYLAEPFRYAETLVVQKAQGRPLSVLDIGCGTGIHALRFASLGMQVTGVDLSFKSIESAQANAQRLDLPCKFFCADVLEFLKTSSQEYDVIYAGACLYYFDLPTAIDLIKNRLRPDGLFVCVETYGGNPIMSGLRLLRGKIKGDRDSATLHSLLRKRGIAQLSANFRDPQVRFFDALTLGGLIFKKYSVVGKAYHNFAVRLDRAVLNHFGLSAAAFRFVFSGLR